MVQKKIQSSNSLFVFFFASQENIDIKSIKLLIETHGHKQHRSARTEFLQSNHNGVSRTDH